MSRYVLFCKKGDFLSDPMAGTPVAFSSAERLASRYDEIYMVHNDNLTYFKIPSSFMKANMRYDRLMERYKPKKGVSINFSGIKEFVIDVVDVRGKIDEKRGSFKPVKK